MHRLLCPLLVLCSLSLIGCGFLDEDIHRADSELLTTEGIGGFGIGGFGNSGCGCGMYGRAHGRALHAPRYPGLMSELYLDEMYISGRYSEEGNAKLENEGRHRHESMPDTPVESLAAHAEASRREALREFAR